MDAIALHDDALHLPGFRAHGAHARIHVHADLPARAVGGAIASPAADVVILDDHVMRAGQQPDCVLLRAFERDAAHDDVGRRDRDVVLLTVAGIERDPFAGVKHVTARRAAVGDVDLLRAALQLHGACDWKTLIPGAGIQARTAELDFVLRPRLEMHEAAAALGVARIEPERQAFAPCGIAVLTKLNGAAARSWIRRRRPINADRFESGDGPRLCSKRRRGTRQRKKYQRIADHRASIARRSARVYRGLPPMESGMSGEYLQRCRLRTTALNKKKKI